jgi:hypothetical protein
MLCGDGLTTMKGMHILSIAVVGIGEDIGK